MIDRGQFRRVLRRCRPVAAILGGAGFLAFLWWLRHLAFFSEPILYACLEITGSLLCFTYAANALVRFRGTHDRVSLILAFGFALTGLIEAAATFPIYSALVSGAGHMQVPLTWMVSRTLLAVVVLAALFVERRLPNSREPVREITAAFIVVAVVAYLTSAIYLGVATEPPVYPGDPLVRPWDLIPAALFFAAAMALRRRRRVNASAFDRGLWWGVWLNVVAHLVATQSAQLLDAPFTAAQVLKVTGYALVLGGALLDNARLFDQVRRMAITDSLTGLANYRTLLTALEQEIERSRRSGRSFSVLLFDLDGLKSINDRYGHLVGTRSICRLASILRVHCRALDTAARYGGDEFALVLPEAGAEAAARVAQRICDRMAGDGELPRVTVSAGAAVFPQDGDTIEKLLGAADRALYGMKGRSSGVPALSRIAACL